MQAALRKPKDVDAGQALAAFKTATKVIAASLYHKLDPGAYSGLLKLTDQQSDSADCCLDPELIDCVTSLSVPGHEFVAALLQHYRDFLYDHRQCATPMRRWPWGIEHFYKSTVWLELQSKLVRATGLSQPVLTTLRAQLEKDFAQEFFIDQIGKAPQQPPMISVIDEVQRSKVFNIGGKLLSLFSRARLVHRLASLLTAVFLVFSKTEQLKIQKTSLFITKLRFDMAFPSYKAPITAS